MGAKPQTQATQNNATTQSPAGSAGAAPPAAQTQTPSAATPSGQGPGANAENTAKPTPKAVAAADYPVIACPMCRSTDNFVKEIQPEKTKREQFRVRTCRSCKRDFKEFTGKR